VPAAFATVSDATAVIFSLDINAEATCKPAVLTNVWSSAEVTLIVVTLVPVRAVVNVPLEMSPGIFGLDPGISCVTTASCTAVSAAELMMNVHVLYPFACVTATPLLVAAIACDDPILRVQRSSPAQ